MLKHERAHAHLKALRKEVQRFLESHPHRTTAEKVDAEGCEYDIRVWGLPPVPTELALIAGDAIHNARSTLDRLAYRLSTVPSANTKFPIHEKATARNGKTITPQIDGAPSAILPIVESVQPYHGGENHLLGLLHQLDIADKHHLGLATANAFDGVAHDIEETSTGEAELAYAWGALEDGQVVAHVRFNSPKPHFDPQFVLTPCVTINDPRVFGEDVCHLIFRMLQHVAKVAGMFTPFLAPT